MSKGFLISDVNYSNFFLIGGQNYSTFLRVLPTFLSKDDVVCHFSMNLHPIIPESVPDIYLSFCLIAKTPILKELVCSVF